MTDNLFDGFDLRGLELPNRVVMAPMTRARAVTEAPDDLTVRYYRQRAGAGLIVTEGSPVSHEGTGYLFTPGLYTEEQTAGWRRVTTAVRERGGRIFAQLWHVGRASHVSLQPGGAAPVSATSRASGYTAFAYQPDGVPGRVPASAPRALRTAEVARVADDFATAAANADAAGFHGVELHAATQYLFEQFLNAEVNDRTDRYGARTVADRIRFTLEVVDAVTARLGSHRVGIRLSPFSTVGNMPPDDRTEETYLALGTELAARDLAYVHLIDTSVFVADDSSLARQVHGLLHRLRPMLGRTPVILAGGLTQRSATALIGRGVIDLAAFGRPFISNPDLVERFRDGIPLVTADPETFFGGGEAGYVDYPPATDPADARGTEASDLNARVIAEFRANGGRLGGRFAGASMLLLHTTGARSGREHVSPVVYLADAGRYLIFATNGGADSHPAWYHNLRANAAATIEVGSTTVPVHAVELREPERTRLFARQVERHPGFDDYQRGTSRVIPVLALEPPRDHVPLDEQGGRARQA
ncbi:MULTISPECIES: nitroreductase/quinone reductase family protein [Catenuloplanes]|uniref:Deazaflavin-dependent oxidoreductase (Nitroreductase family) n=1 Tax=Catenuloplanes niger TaxID=587534 RepID=A0AAE3ZTN3_9ACTN|nr:nitroreductase/quinone reductase family protein [Catenuloplanes niger]MDR7325879.1 deazaflavin-dependent oxidoreductase (nitroreductase family) [Catenuloplanes niger]